MAFRGRGRGRGRGMFGRGVDRIAKKEPFILFPEDVTLPSLPSISTITSEDKKIYRLKYKFELFWPNSCYHLQQESFPTKKSKGMKGQQPKVPMREEEDVEIERFSDKPKQSAKCEALESYLIQTLSNFPSELIQGKKRPLRATRKLRWNLGGKTADIFAKFDEKYKDNEEDDDEDDDEKKKKKKDEDEDEEEQPKEEESEESDDDYNQNENFDDDEDDYNQEDEPDEDYYED